MIAAAKLDYAEAQNDHVDLRSEGKTWRKQWTISSLESALDPQRFLRVHRSFLVNMERIVGVEQNTKDTWVAVLRDGTKTPVSRAGYRTSNRHAYSISRPVYLLAVEKAFIPHYSEAYFGVCPRQHDANAPIRWRLRIGLLSDSHGFLDDAVFHHFAKCDEVWHAGDFGTTEVLDRLRAFRPVRGVYGNVDGAELRADLPEDLVWECEGVTVYMTHVGAEYDLCLDEFAEQESANRRSPAGLSSAELSPALPGQQPNYWNRTSMGNTGIRPISKSRVIRPEYGPALPPTGHIDKHPGECDATGIVESAAVQVWVRPRRYTGR